MSERVTTVNKIGGANMAKLDQVQNLISVLEQRKENIVLVVSAFKGVTNKLIAAMDALNGTDYTEANIYAAFEPVKKLHVDIIENEKFFRGAQKAEAYQVYAATFEILKKSLLTHKEISRVLMPVDDSYQIRDQVYGFGEQMAAKLLAIFCAQLGIACENAEGITCDKEAMGNGVISNRKLQKGIQTGIKSALGKTRKGVVRILGGHVLGTPRGISTDQGRGYSDITAVDTTIALQDLGEIVAATRFWKDVDGVVTADPDELDLAKNKPFLHRDISIAEALENAAAGSDLLNVRALSRAQQHGITLQIRNIHKAEQDVGTNIVNGEVLTQHAFKTIVSNPHVDSLVVIYPEMADQPGFGEAIMKIFNKHSVSVDGTLSEGTSITFSIPMPRDASEREAYREKIRAIQTELKEIEVNGERYTAPQSPTWNKGNQASISLIGRELRDQVGILADISGVFPAWGINIEGIGHGSVQTRISYLVGQEKRKLAVQLLHSIFVDGDEEVIREYDRRNVLGRARLRRTFQ